MRTLHLVESPSPIVERIFELDALRAAVRGGGGVVLLEAAAGLGKTILLDHGAALAAETGWQVRRAAPGPLERHFPFGLVRTLLEAPVRESGMVLDGAAAAAGELLLNGYAPRGDSTMMLIAHSISWVCRELGDGGAVGAVPRAARRAAAGAGGRRRALRGPPVARRAVLPRTAGG